MADRLATIRARVLVEYSQFVMFDHFGEARLIDLGLPDDPRWVGHAGVGGVLFHASDRSLEAAVQLELWSAAPDPVPVLSGQSHFEGLFTTDSGRVKLAALTGSANDQTVDLSGPGAYRILATRLGDEFDSSVEGQIESWDLQVWPEPAGKVGEN